MKEMKMKMKIVAGRQYVMGRGVLDTADRLQILVLDVAADKIVSAHQKASDATLAMTRYAEKNGIKTQMALAADFGLDKPLIVTETY